MDKSIKRQVLQSLDIGDRVAEKEKALKSYFVETIYWQEVFRGNKDLVYGPKGSGKSAIYSYLISQSTKLLNERNTLVIAAETLQGTTVFEELSDSLPNGEKEFQSIWKLYFLMLIAKRLAERVPSYGIAGDATRELFKILEKNKLLSLPKGNTLVEILQATIDIVNRMSVGVNFQVDAASSTLNIIPHINIRKKEETKPKPNSIALDDLLKIADRALKEANLRIWIAIDHLDRAFQYSEGMERIALRALFRVYSRLSELERVSLKIFLRDDIWERITISGYREASSLTSEIRLKWDRDLLLNVLIRRLLHNQSLREVYGVNQFTVLGDQEKQWELFYKVFPDQVETGRSRPKTFEWMLTSITDGTGKPTPRELIHLILAARDAQLNRFRLGSKEPPGTSLFDRESLKRALDDVSFERLNKFLYTEYPECRPYLQSLEGKRARQTPKMLAKNWKVNIDEAIEKARGLAKIGAFEVLGTGDTPIFSVSKILHPVLHIDDKPTGAGETTPASTVSLETPASEKGKDKDSITKGPAEAVKEEVKERTLEVAELAHHYSDDAFYQICAAFDDPAQEVRNGAARALFNIQPDSAGSFTRALREGSDERRRKIGQAIASSGLASEMINRLTGESRDKTYEGFSILFLMSKAGEVQPLFRAIENHPNNHVRLAVVKLLALSGQMEILPSLRRLAVHGSLPSEVRSAVMEAIFEISSKTS